MKLLSCLMVGVALCWPTAPAAAQVVRAPEPAVQLPHVISVPMTPVPLTVKVEVQRPPDAAIGNSVSGTAIPQPVSSVATSVGPAAEPANLPAASAAASDEQSGADVQVVPPPPDNAEDNPDADCRVDDDINVMTPAKDCTEVAANDVEGWAQNDEADLQNVDAAQNQQADTTPGRNRDSSVLVVGAVVALLVLVGIRLFRRR